MHGAQAGVFIALARDIAGPADIPDAQERGWMYAPLTIRCWTEPGMWTLVTGK